MTDTYDALPLETGAASPRCYIDARATLGHMVELYPEDPVIRALYRQARVAPLRWNGTPLIIPWE